METDYFQHPHRFPQNAVGAFYTTGYQTRETDAPDARMVWCANCLQCEAPEAEAPELLAPLSDENLDTYFVRQPESDAEVARACMAARVCCTAALRYGGKNRSIIQQLQNSPELCDYFIGDDDKLQLTVGADGALLPFAKRIVKREDAECQRKYRLRNKQWWHFWR